MLNPAYLFKWSNAIRPFPEVVKEGRILNEIKHIKP
jgi:hypothetical protein